MNKKGVRFIDVVFWIALIATDLFIYFIFGLLLMGYDDSYDSSKGEYWSLSSMNTTEKSFYIGLQVWNVINIVAVIYIGYKVYKRIKNRA